MKKIVNMWEYKVGINVFLCKNVEWYNGTTAESFCEILLTNDNK